MFTRKGWQRKNIRGVKRGRKGRKKEKGKIFKEIYDYIQLDLGILLCNGYYC